MFGIIKRLIQWSGHYRKRIYSGFVLAFITGIFIALPIVLAAMAIQLILADLAGSATMTTGDLFKFLGLMVVAVLGRFVFSYLKAKIQDTVIYERLADERIEIGDILKRVPLGFFSKHQTGELVTSLTTDLSFMEHHAMSMLDMVVSGYITTVVMLLFCMTVRIELGVMMLIGLIFSMIFLYFMGKCSRKNAPVLLESNRAMTGAVIEYLRGIALVKAFHQEGASSQGILSAYKDSKNINIKIEKEYAIFNFLHMVSLKLASAGMVFYAGVLCLQGEMALPEMIFVDILSFVVFSSAESFSSAFHVLNVIDHTLDQLDALKQAPFIDEDGQDLTPKSMDIAFEDVSFGYGNQPVLKHLSCTFPEKRFTAIVGPSGSGKTTICNLMARFYDVSAGRITLGGTDLRAYTCDSVLKQMSIVFQNVYLFNESIVENIRFGKPEATMEEVIDAAKRARCHDFIMQLPQGYDTIAGEGGATLSGGERQRISIARAILKDAPLVILDEATSSVDPENEHLIQGAIRELVRGKTVSAIAHRLPTIEHADQILVIKDGELVQHGTHQGLLQEEGTYKHFVEIREASEGWSL